MSYVFDRYAELESVVEGMLSYNLTFLQIEDLIGVPHATACWWVHHIVKREDPDTYLQLLDIIEKHKKIGRPRKEVV